MSELISLTSSLPELFEFTPPKMTEEEFLSSCSSFVGEKDLDALKRLFLVPDVGDKFEAGSFAGKYVAWELALRNSIAKIRIERLGASFDGAQRYEAGFESDAASAAVQAYAAKDPLEREKVLDHARWLKVEELSLFHRFDLDALCAYAVKLALTLKYSDRNEKGRPSDKFDDVVGKVASSENVSNKTNEKTVK